MMKMEHVFDLTAVLRRVRHSRMLFPPQGFGRISLRLKRVRHQALDGFATRLRTNASFGASVLRRKSRRNPDWTPDPFDVAQGRGEHIVEPRYKHSGVTILESHLLAPATIF